MCLLVHTSITGPSPPPQALGCTVTPAFKWWDTWAGPGTASRTLHSVPAVMWKRIVWSCLFKIGLCVDQVSPVLPRTFSPLPLCCVDSLCHYTLQVSLSLRVCPPWLVSQGPLDARKTNALLLNHIFIPSLIIFLFCFTGPWCFLIGFC